MFDGMWVGGRKNGVGLIRAPAAPPMTQQQPSSLQVWTAAYIPASCVLRSI